MRQPSKAIAMVLPYWRSLKRLKRAAADMALWLGKLAALAEDSRLVTSACIVFQHPSFQFKEIQRLLLVSAGTADT